MADVRQYAQRYNIPYPLANALIGQESGGQAGVVSPAGATGLTQVMPGTAAGMYGITPAEAAQRLKNPDFALDAGFRYLRQQKDTFGSWRLALAAYNAGPNAVRKYGGVPPYQETQDYVRNILAKAGALDAGADSVTPAPSTTAPGATLPAAAQTTPQVDPRQQSTASGLQGLAQGKWDPEEQLSFLRQLRAAGTAVAAAPQLFPELPVSIQGPSTARDRQVVSLARTYLGTPYVYGGSKPGGFDCSGLLQFVWHRQGVDLPRTTYDQWHFGKAVKGALRPGDAVFFTGSDPNAQGEPGHVGMYIGGGKFIEAPHTGAQVRISKLKGRSDFVGARRFG